MQNLFHLTLKINQNLDQKTSQYHKCTENNLLNNYITILTSK